MVTHDLIAGILGAWSYTPGLWADLFKIALSVLLAAIIGTERSVKRHSAGLRTFIIMSLAATTAMVLDSHLQNSHGLTLISAATVVASAIICVNSTRGNTLCSAQD